MCLLTNRGGFICWMLIGALLAGCGRSRKESSAPLRFTLPEIPTMISSPEERAVYLGRHYWDRYDFQDTLLVSSNEVTEQAFANYVQILGMLSPEERKISVGNLLDRASEADSMVFERFTDLFDKYLYDPNSPLRNEELYIPVLEYMVASPRVPEIEKIRPRDRLAWAMRNRVGTRANDFTYTLASGATGTLYGVRADYTILFFNNPDCPACKQMREEISASPILTRRIEEGKIKVLAVYPDEDLTAWRNYRRHIPANWINAYDASLVLRNGELYDLKAIPTLYLLDRDKTVLLKDCLSVDQIIDFFEQSMANREGVVDRN